MPPDILLGELLLYYFEWMSTQKVTDACSKNVYNLLHLLLPADADTPKWSRLKTMLEHVFNQNVIAVDICPNDCISYVDAKHPSLSDYKHSHRTKCNKCGEARFININGKKVPAKRGYYFPMDE